MNVKELRFSENQKMAKKDLEMRLDCLFDFDSKNPSLNTASNIEVIDLSNTYIGSKKQAELNTLEKLLENLTIFAEKKRNIKKLILN